MTKAEFDEWIEQHHQDVRKVAFKIVGPKVAKTEIEDLIQRALIRIYQTESYLRCRISPLTWITNAVKDAAREARRSHGRASAMMADVDVLVDYGSGSSLPVGGTPQRRWGPPLPLKVIDLAVKLGVLSKALIVALEGLGHKGLRAMSPLPAETANELTTLHRRSRLIKAQPVD
jgi:hypothetical protein